MLRCTGPNDCAGGLFCKGAFHDAGRRFTGECSADMPVMTGMQGMLCAANQDCNSGLCVEGECAEHCQTDLDCFSGVCLGVEPQTGQYRALDPVHPAGWVSACVLPNGTTEVCVEDADCVLPGEQCLAFTDGETLTPRYMCAIPNAARFNMPCGLGPTCSPDLQCAPDAVSASPVCARACPGGVTDCQAGESCVPIAFNDQNTPATGDDIVGSVCIQ
jgi:hypothetical protein